MLLSLTATEECSSTCTGVEGERGRRGRGGGGGERVEGERGGGREGGGAEGERGRRGRGGRGGGGGERVEGERGWRGRDGKRTKRVEFKRQSYHVIQSSNPILNYSFNYP